MEKLQGDEAAVTRSGATKALVLPPGLDTKITRVQEAVSGSNAVHKPKKGSVIPPKRKLVKRMMLDSIIASLICCGHSLSSSNSKKKTIFPHSAPASASHY